MSRMLGINYEISSISKVTNGTSGRSFSGLPDIQVVIPTLLSGKKKNDAQELFGYRLITGIKYRNLRGHF